MRLEVLRGRSQVEPIRIREEAEHVVSRGDHHGEHITFDRDWSPAVHPSRIAGSNRYVPALMSPGTAQLGLLPELLHPPVRAGQHQTERPGVLDVVERDGGARASLPVEREHRGQVQVGEDVPVQREEGFVTQCGERVDDRPAGAERRGLGDPGDRGSPWRDWMNGSNISSRYGDDRTTSWTP